MASFLMGFSSPSSDESAGAALSNRAFICSYGNTPSITDIQNHLGVKADGIIGPETIAAWEDRKNQEFAEKIFDPKTYKPRKEKENE